MSYIVSSTANPTGWRPWASRLQGLGRYARANFPLPTRTPGFSPTPVGPRFTGGLGINIMGREIDTTTILLAGGAVLAFMSVMAGMKRKRRRRPTIQSTA
jgi:hypothetical protein